MRINRHDTNGTKPLLGKGELGYDDYTAGGDTGRVYVGTGTENIALAERLESNMMTKAQFNALAEERKANRAGSGFEVPNSNTSQNAYWVNVQNGIKASTGVSGSASNQFAIGGLGDVNDIVEKTIINGVVQNISYVASPTKRLFITLPTAPNIYPYDTVLTAEQIASGVIKHADASNSGLIVNGNFDVDASGWVTTGVNWNWSAGSMVLSSTSDADQLKQNITTINGKKYILEFDITALTGNLKLMNTALIQLYTISRTGRHIVELLGDVNLTSIIFTRLTVGVNASCTIDNIAVYPADAISRSDLVFLESWHEDISEKNFVYPLGNTQYLGGNTDGLTGIANGAFTGFETYSLFLRWQTPSAIIGKGYVWSSLTEAQKRAFVSNPENNCYLDGDKVIQVRYRVRVAQGLGDVWGVNTNDLNFGNNEWGRHWNGVSSTRVPGTFPQGKSSVIPHAEPYLTTKHPAMDPLNGGSGIAISLGLTGLSYTNRTYALPIALASRRNQGMYHNVYNPNGTKLASDGLDCFRTTVSFTSISDCFDPAKLLTASGYIGTVSGRPDGLFYDQVHESDIQDLRNSSKKVEDYNRLINREFNKLVAGSTRGNEGEVQIFSKVNRVLSFGNFDSLINTRKYLIGDSDLPTLPITLVDGIQMSYPVIMVVKSGADSGKILASKVYNKASITFFSFGNNSTTQEYPVRYTDGTIPSVLTGQTVDIHIACPTTRTKSNTLLHCDIIGNPTNYPTSWKESGVFGTPLIVAEDGTSLLPNGVLDAFKLSRKANATPLLCLRSTDSGTTWTSFTPAFSTTTNAITLTDEPAGNLVMVYYQTHTSMAVPVINSKVLEIGDVYANQSNGVLMNTLINKSNTVIGEVVTYTSKILQWVEKPLLSGAGTFAGQMLRQNYYGYNPSHGSITLYHNINIPTVKVFPYLTRLNGKAYLNLVFKEMKYNGTSWGDDSKFNIVDNVSTTTDNNAQTVLVGQKTVELPYFIAGDE